MKSCEGAPKLDRKTVEKNRRILMKDLVFKLSSLIPKDQRFSKDILSQHDYLDYTASYITHMKERIERLKQRKAAGTGDEIHNQDKFSGIKLPLVEVRRRESGMEVVLISGNDNRSVFHEVVSALEEEGAEIVNGSFSVGLDASNVYERLTIQLVERDGRGPTH